MVRPTLTNMYPVEIRYYPLMISLNKCAGSSNVLFPEICFLKATKDINVKAFNMTTNKNEAKAMTEHISCVCKCIFNRIISKTIIIKNNNQKLNNTTSQCKCRNYRKYKKGYSWNPSICICENSKYLKSIADTSVTQCDKIVNVMDIVSTKKKQKRILQQQMLRLLLE